ncbi:MAG: lipid exporter, fused ATPase and inner rane subunit MsbA [Geobacteraceae bacterium]|nr:lipid exporter, fused ATPase and inner rane subunit MsbA [Geobacteraceae bacterium]
MNLFARVLRYSKPYWWRITVAIIATVGVAGMDGAIAYLVKPVLERIFSEKDMGIFLILPLGVIAVFAFRSVCRFVYEYFIQTAGQLAIQDIRQDLYRKHMSLSMRFFNNNPTGNLMSRILNDVSVMQEGVANIVTGLLREGFTAFGLLGVIFYRNWQLAIISFIAIPVTVYPAQKIGKRIKKLSSQSLGKMGIISHILQETFSGIKVIKAFGLEEREVGKFAKFNNEFYHIIRKTIKYAAMSTPVMELITSFGIAAVIWYGGSLVIQGKMTGAEFFSFMAAMVMLYSPVKKLLGTYNVIQRSVGAAERVFAILDEKPEIQDGPLSRDFLRAAGDVEFRNVSFCYNEEYVVKNVNLSARPGEVIALVGPSGGGKTTLVSLVPRFYEVSSGAIYVDGLDIRELKLRDLMQQIALVDQETILFNDTIENNIKYGKPDATREEVEAAAKAAFAHEFITELPEGYETNIGDRGVRVSGGQRQRICIARAILKNAPILILDEATSALDTESEQMVQKALNNLMSNRTTFVIAHRLSTILHADKIAVIDKGEIVESGTHHELLENGGLYRKLYEMQFA